MSMFLFTFTLHEAVKFICCTGRDQIEKRILRKNGSEFDNILQNARKKRKNEKK